jgi:hydroxyethylthiazole kinase-like uncharacterized protein yjeF
MQRAAAASAAEIARRFSDELAHGVVIATGAGNNGGDGWIIARALHAVGIPVRVVEYAAARTPDALAERILATQEGVRIDVDASALLSGGERIAVDALLGTGYSAATPLRAEMVRGIADLRALAGRGAHVIAVDLPSGLDASTGENAGGLTCELTLTFGTVKRGQLIARDACGTIVLLDIGLGIHTASAGRAHLATPRWFREMLPRIQGDAHKGTRKKIAIVGGAPGMAGAAMLAARGALRSGAGMVKCLVAKESVLALQEGEPAALTAEWPASLDDFAEHVSSWADALLVGPGLGKARARELVEFALRSFQGPVVLDADALNAFAGEPESLASLVGTRAALLTPHPAEFGRLASMEVSDVLAQRFEAPSALAKRAGATVLLKGVPTVISAPSGEMMVVAEGTPILATGGSGDLLGGIAVTLLAQTGDALLAGALAAFAHGRAAAAAGGRQVRGYTLDDVLASLPGVWSLAAPTARPPVLLELPRVSERA